MADRVVEYAVPIVSSLTPMAQPTPMSNIEELLKRLTESALQLPRHDPRSHPPDLHFDAVHQRSVPLADPPLTHLVVVKKACAGTTLHLLHERANAFLHVPGRETNRPVASGGQRPRPIQEPPFLCVGQRHRFTLSNRHGGRG